MTDGDAGTGRRDETADTARAADPHAGWPMSGSAAQAACNAAKGLVGVLVLLVLLWLHPEAMSELLDRVIDHMQP